MQDRAPEFDGHVAADGEVPHHLKRREVGSIADQVEIIRADARLDRSFPATIRLVEVVPESLHAAADEQRGVVVFGNDASVLDQREAELLETAPDYVKRAKRRVISLSSIGQVQATKSTDALEADLVRWCCGNYALAM